MSEIGQRIKQRRMELTWSQRDLADKMGYSNHSTIARIESGKVDIPQSKIIKFSKVLGVPIEYLISMEDSDEVVITDPQLKRLVAYYNKLNERDQNMIQTMLDTMIGKDDAI